MVIRAALALLCATTGALSQYCPASATLTEVFGGLEPGCEPSDIIYCAQFCCVSGTYTCIASTPIASCAGKTTRPNGLSTSHSSSRFNQPCLHMFRRTCAANVDAHFLTRRTNRHRAVSQRARGRSQDHSDQTGVSCRQPCTRRSQEPLMTPPSAACCNKA